MQKRRSVSAQFGKLLPIMVLGMVLVALFLGGLIYAGIFDPIPHPDHFTTESLGNHTIPAFATETHWVKSFTDNQGLIAGISLEHIGGNSDISLGMLWGDDDRYLAIMVTPQGQAWVSEFALGQERVLLLPQPWVHVGEFNEILVEENAGSTTIWLNREILWQGSLSPFKPQIGWTAVNYSQKSDIQTHIRWHKRQE
jgi:hypothetical protein